MTRSRSARVWLLLAAAACKSEPAAPMNPMNPVLDAMVPPMIPVPDAVVPPMSGALRRSAQNPRYFADASGRVVYLTGSHTWHNLQDIGPSYPPSGFDYDAFLDFLDKRGHNMFRLWAWEQTRWTPDQDTDDFWFYPHVYQRTGPGLALDGQPRFDVSRLNQAYFDRMRDRVMRAGTRGIYVAVMLFEGWSVSFPKGSNSARNPWHGHPFNAQNNINGIDGDTDRDDSGDEINTLAIAEVTQLQKTLVRKVIDTVGDLDNVLYEVSNESPADSIAWQNAMIDFVHDYEAGEPKQHPVGLTVPYPNGDNTALFASPADWISPRGDLENPGAADGSKVILWDTDHLCGVCGSTSWVWKSLTSGLNPLFMDGDDSNGNYWVFRPTDTRWDAVRQNLGYARRLADALDLGAMTPQPALASSRYCLAVTGAGAAYVVFVPSGSTVSVDLTGAGGTLAVEWLDPATGARTTGTTVAGGAPRTLTAPVSSGAVLYLHH